MVDKPRRPTLHLKFPAAAPAEDGQPKAVPLSPRRAQPNVFIPEPRAKPAFRPRPAPPPVAAPPRPSFDWKCKPCGKGFVVAPELTDDEAVRCPNCNARLGLARDFRAVPPNVDKVRARFVAKS
jgi:DNA-directed RNA polymerase subunit RPC12/RpoP